MMTTQAWENRTGLVSTGHPRTILGYGWPWTVRPGDAVDFKVSVYEDGPYDASLVRIICGDNLSDPAMFKEEEISAAFAGSYPGRRQEIHAGSYVEIASKPCLDDLESFSVQAMVFPTAMPKGPFKQIISTPLAQPHANQHLISRWDESTRSGWALLIDEDNRAAFQIGDGDIIHRASLDTPLVEDRWFLVVASFDLIFPPLSGPETVIVWTTKGTTNAEQEAQAGRDYRQAA